MRISKLVWLAFPVAGLCALSIDCLGATELKVVLTTDANCGDLRKFGTRIVVTSNGVVGSPVVATTCDEATQTIGTIVLTPQHSRDAQLLIEVVTSFKKDPTECVSGKLDGCIIARRALTYIEHTPLTLPIAMNKACLAVDCQPDQTCVDGACKNSTIDPAKCTDPKGCDQSKLGDADGGAREAGGDAAPTVCAAGLEGPSLVPIPGGYCIDSTEVTISHYQKFLAAKVDPKTQPAVCAWNTPFTSSNFDPTKPSFPITSINWCDAYAYCKWAGKRLCGKIGGGSLDPGFAAGTDPATAQWFRACSAAGTKTFPYGTGFVKGACNGPVVDGSAISAGSSPTCQGGYSGLFDMSGNAEEWQDWCDPSDSGDPSLDRCHELAGSFFYSQTDPQNSMLCAFGDTDKRSDTLSDLGFRCCSP